MGVRAKTSKFESAVLENLDAAHNLARWLLRNDADAQDVVQEACMKALKAFESYRGGDFRAWFLAIVRNTCFTNLRRNKSARGEAPGQSLELAAEISADCEIYDPELIAIRAADAAVVNRAIEALPDALRETLILREMEGLSYKEIGKVVGVPIGTVMSRLARGRTQLQSLLADMDQPATRKTAQEGTR